MLGQGSLDKLRDVLFGVTDGAQSVRYAQGLHVINEAIGKYGTCIFRLSPADVFEVGTGGKDIKFKSWKLIPMIGARRVGRSI